MGTIDIEGKKYLSNNLFFADAFNYLLYGGEEVIKPEQLKELDTAELMTPYGNSARVPVQKYRDLLRIWSAMTDENAIYVILGAELQNKVHYGMPVKDGLYDMLGYSRQIEEIRKSYSQTKTGIDDGEFAAENGTLKIKLSSEEFLSGLRKNDRLMPIITVVVYLGEKPWDGPKSLFDMLQVSDDRLYHFLNDYRINLISPADMGEDEFAKFHTDLGFAMKMIKHQADDADEIIMQTGHHRISSDTAYFLKSAIKLDLDFEESTGGVDMCKALEKKEKRDRILGVIDYMKGEGKADSDIIAKIVEMYQVTEDFVVALLTPKKA